MIVTFWQLSEKVGPIVSLCTSTASPALSSHCYPDSIKVFLPNASAKFCCLI